MLTYFCCLLRDLFWYLCPIILFQLLWHVMAARRRKGKSWWGSFFFSFLFSEKVRRKTFLFHQIWYVNVPLPVAAPEPPAANLLVAVRILSPISHSFIMTSSAYQFPGGRCCCLSCTLLLLTRYKEVEGACNPAQWQGNVGVSLALCLHASPVSSWTWGPLGLLFAWLDLGSGPVRRWWVWHSCVLLPHPLLAASTPCLYIL